MTDIPALLAPPNPPKSALPTLLTLALLLLPYSLLASYLNLPSRLSPPLPSLLLLLSTFFLTHLALPSLVPLYASPTPKGRYGALWTASNINWAATSVLGWAVMWCEPAWQDGRKREGPFVCWAVGAVLLGLMINILFGDSDESPWNAPRIERDRLMAEAKLAKMKADLELVAIDREGKVVFLGDLEKERTKREKADKTGETTKSVGGSE